MLKRQSSKKQTPRTQYNRTYITEFLFDNKKYKFTINHNCDKLKCLLFPDFRLKRDYSKVLHVDFFLEASKSAFCNKFLNTISLKTETSRIKNQFVNIIKFADSSNIVHERCECISYGADNKINIHIFRIKNCETFCYFFIERIFTDNSGKKFLDSYMMQLSLDDSYNYIKTFESEDNIIQSKTQTCREAFQDV